MLASGSPCICFFPWKLVTTSAVRNRNPCVRCGKATQQQQTVPYPLLSPSRLNRATWPPGQAGAAAAGMARGRGQVVGALACKRARVQPRQSRSLVSPATEEKAKASAAPRRDRLQKSELGGAVRAVCGTGCLARHGVPRRRRWHLACHRTDRFLLWIQRWRLQPRRLSPGGRYLPRGQSMSTLRREGSQIPTRGSTASTISTSSKFENGKS